MASRWDAQARVATSLSIVVLGGIVALGLSGGAPAAAGPLQEMTPTPTVTEGTISPTPTSTPDATVDMPAWLPLALKGVGVPPTVGTPATRTPTSEPTASIDTPTPTTTAPSTAGPSPEPSPTGSAPPRPPFAAYEPVPVDVVVDGPDYVPDLGRLANPEDISGLTAAQRTALESSGFVVVPAVHKQFYDLYVRDAAADVPAFVTTDALLHAYHMLHLNALRGVEQAVLIDEAAALTAAMLDAAEAGHKAAPVEVESAAFQSTAFFAVAARLLDPNATVPPDVEDTVQAELALIDAHTGVAPSPIFGYDEDYSQYVPRGHYNGTTELQRYFRAMMWYGRIGFRLDEKLAPAITRRETRAALLIAEALQDTPVGTASALEVWDHIYDVTAFFVGTADDLTVHDYADLAVEVYGHVPTASDLVDEARLDAFMARARTLRPPAILNTPIRPGQDAQSATMGFRFMGQRYIPDSDIFQQLIFDKVGGGYRGDGSAFTTFDGVRSFPRGLDVPAALGSARALAILEGDGDTDYDGYTEQFEKVQTQFGTLEPERWSSNLYWSWLDSLRPLLPQRGEGFPYFMRSTAWTDKSLNTWLGSWSQLRHDSILYAKPTMPGPTGMPREPRGYVEPNPWLYARLAALSSQARRGLDERGLLDAGLSSRFQRLESLLLALKSISETELEGGALTEAQFTTIRLVGEDLKRIAQVRADSPDTDKQIAVVADVHTVPLARQVLEEGVGDAFEIYVVVPEPDEHGAPDAESQIVTVGAVYSYYEFKWPMADRLTDQAWQAMDPRPPLPAWTASYLVSE